MKKCTSDAPLKAFYTWDTAVYDIDGWDSLSHRNLIVDVEMGFKVRFYSKELRAHKDVGDPIDRKVAGA